MRKCHQWMNASYKDTIRLTRPQFIHINHLTESTAITRCNHGAKLQPRSWPNGTRTLFGIVLQRPRHGISIGQQPKFRRLQGSVSVCQYRGPFASCGDLIPGYSVFESVLRMHEPLIHECARYKFKTIPHQSNSFIQSQNSRYSQTHTTTL